MEMSQDKRTLRVSVDRVLTASDLELFIIDLAKARSEMSPEVPRSAPDHQSEVLIQNDADVQAAHTVSGFVRLYLRNQGLGWLAFTVDGRKAAGLAQYILSRTTPGESIDFFTEKLPEGGRTQ